MLRRMKPGIFDTGLYETDDREEFRWVAVRGQIHDWTIYHAPADWNQQRIRSMGKKLLEMDTVRELVPCTDPAFRKYRK